MVEGEKRKERRETTNLKIGQFENGTLCQFENVSTWKFSNLEVEHIRRCLKPNTGKQTNNLRLTNHKLFQDRIEHIQGTDAKIA